MKTKIIGLTGGIGSGKTTIARFFAEWGVPVYIADDEAKKILYLPDTVGNIASAFGRQVLTDGLPDRKKIAQLVFNDPAKLDILNSIIHPKVKMHFSGWVTQYRDRPAVIKEAAILFESGTYKDCDEIILVTAPVDVRVQRVMLRDGATESEVLDRMKSQWSDERKAALSTYVINNVVLDEARRQAADILKIIQKNEE